MVAMRSSETLTTIYMTARRHNPENYKRHVRFQVLTAASMMFRIVFWDVLPRKKIVDQRCIDNHFTRQYIPEDNSEHCTNDMFTVVLISELMYINVIFSNYRSSKWP
jgi:hypothetical protein